MSEDAAALTVVTVEPLFVAEQMRVVLEDLGADAVKLGMLGSRETALRVAQVLEAQPRQLPVVIDPVMVSSHGERLLAQDAIDVLVARLMPRAALLTPNLAEASALTGVELHTVDDMRHAAELLLLRGAEAVLLTGGHLHSETVVDVLRTADGLEVLYEDARIETTSTHGTGCTLASAIAVGLGEGLTLDGAIVEARAYLREALRTAPGLGQGLGPLNHAHPLWQRSP